MATTVDAKQIGAGGSEPLPDRLAAILEIGRALGSTLELDTLLTLLVEHASRLLDADRCTVFIHDEQRAELWSKVGIGLEHRLIRVPLARGLAGAAATLRRPVNVVDAYADPRFDDEVDQGTGYRTGSVLAVPLLSRAGRLVGVLQALNRRGGPFDAQDEQMALALGGQAASAIENGRLYQAVLEKNAELSAAEERLRLALREIDALFEIERQASAGGELDDFLGLVLARSVELTEAEAGSLLLAGEEEARTLLFHKVVGEKGPELERLTIPMGRGIAGVVAASGEPLRVDDPQSDPRFDRQLAERIGFPVRSVLAVPLLWETARFGALELLNHRGGPFREEDLRVATLIAAQAARALHRARGRAEEERQRRLQLVGQMLSGLLHDLRTPLTIASGYTQLMENEDGREERRVAKETILKQFDIIGAMMSEVLAFVRGERALLLRRVHLNGFLDDIEAFLRRDLEGRGIELSVLREFQGTVRFDEGKIQRVIFNLARNAAQAMPGGGRLTLRSSLADGAWMLRCEDSGEGIPAEIAPRIFEAFVTHGKAGGTGLGLALCKRIVEEHGGTIDFAPAAGGGTIFTVRLPLEGPS